MLKIRAFLEKNKNISQVALFRVSREKQSNAPVFIGGSASDSSSRSSLDVLSDGKKSMGFITYDHKNHFEDLHSANPRRLFFPEIFFFTPDACVQLEGTDEDGPYHGPQKAHHSGSITLESRVSRNEYIATVRKLKQHIARGDVYEINYCIEFFAENVRMDPQEVFIDLLNYSDAPFSAFIKCGDAYLIGASPERFLKKEGKKLLTAPIKGTAGRGQTEEEDKAIIRKLANDEKEKAENIMITDLVRNDLSRIAKEGSVRVEELCGIHTFRQVHQMISTVSCELKEGLTLEDIFRASFPMGSMTGAPKIRAMELIEQYEVSRRELYSGCAGYIDEKGDFDFSVVIRSICYNRKEKYLSFMVGSAITDASVPEKEYEECLLKAKAMMEVLGVDFRKFA